MPNFTGQHLDEVVAVLTAHGIKRDNCYGDASDNPDSLDPADCYTRTIAPRHSRCSGCQLQPLVPHWQLRRWVSSFRTYLPGTVLRPVQASLRPAVRQRSSY
ncbi:hypothetical protein ABIA33_007113 [Streptacidiphilus sp. MAP12-16]